MKAFLRRLKLAYTVYNYFHRSALQHNIPLFKKYGIQKKYYSSLSSKDFSQLPRLPNPVTDIKALTETTIYRNADTATQESILAYDENGFIVLRNYLPAATVASINAEMDQLLQKGIVAPRLQRIMFAIHHSALLKTVGEDRDLLALLGILIHGEAQLFQSINFYMGSEQHTHSDSIHMTTYPAGGLLGVWIALDDINENNGPLHYYPGSHTLPYYLNADYNNEGSRWLIGEKDYTDYEAMIAEKIAAQGIQKKVFTARRGDVLIWHANLFHGGEPHKDKSQTRKSMVFHYFKKGAICYHEITQRPALLQQQAL